MPYERCIETWAREEGIGLIPGPGRRGTGENRAEPGKAGRGPRSQQWLGERWPEMELFGGFFQNLYYYAETMGGQK